MALIPVDIFHWNVSMIPHAYYSPLVYLSPKDNYITTSINSKERDVLKSFCP